MFRLFRRRLELAKVLSISHRSIVQDSCATHLDLFSGFGIVFPICIKLFSTGETQARSKKQKECSITLSYLVNSCGLSPETAKSVAQRVKLHSFKNPDLVLQIFKNHGFSDTQIAKIVRFRPGLLAFSAEKSILPKIEFLKSIGLSDAELADACSSTPAVLGQSLENMLIPNYKFLKSMLVSDENVIKIYRKRTRLLSYDLQKIVSPKLAVFRKLGIPEAYLMLIVSCYPAVVLQGQDKFDDNVKKVMEMGFDPRKCKFIHAMQVFASFSQSTLEHKSNVYSKFGWSDEDMRLAFSKCPNYMIASETKIVKGFNFLVKKMGFRPSAIAQVPNVLMYSLEKRIIPRFSVIRVLLSKGLINEGTQICLSSLVICSNMHFLDMFVTKYRDQVPQLLNIFLGKMTIGELGLGFEQESGTKKCSR